VKIFSFIFTDLFDMGVKLSLVYSGKNTDWWCSRAGC